jgi:hypothetical protein
VGIPRRIDAAAILPTSLSVRIMTSPPVFAPHPASLLMYQKKPARPEMFNVLTPFAGTEGRHTQSRSKK